MPMLCPRDTFIVTVHLFTRWIAQVAGAYGMFCDGDMAAADSGSEAEYDYDGEGYGSADEYYDYDDDAAAAAAGNA